MNMMNTTMTEKEVQKFQKEAKQLIDTEVSIEALTQAWTSLANHVKSIGQPNKDLTLEEQERLTSCYREPPPPLLLNGILLELDKSKELFVDDTMEEEFRDKLHTSLLEAYTVCVKQVSEAWSSIIDGWVACWVLAALSSPSPVPKFASYILHAQEYRFTIQQLSTFLSTLQTTRRI